MPDLRSAKVLVVAALAMVLALVLTMPGFSTAAFTSRTTNAISTVTSAKDWVAPTVTIDPLAATVTGTVNVTGTATDAGSGLKEVVVEIRPVTGGVWTTLCTSANAAYSCPWDTRDANYGVGQYDLRARASDNAGNQTDPANAPSTRTTVVTSQLRLDLDDPGNLISGTVPLLATLPNEWLYTITIQYRLLPNGSWGTVTSGGGLYGTVLRHDWDTSANPRLDGDYEVRAVATRLFSPTYTSNTYKVTIDNTAPTVILNPPGTRISGVTTFTATASDARSGVSRVVLQHRRNNSGTWTTLCTVNAPPWSCNVDTVNLSTVGTHAFRAIAYDAAGNSTTSATVSDIRVVRQTGAAATMTVESGATASHRSGKQAPKTPAPEVPEQSRGLDPAEEAPVQDASPPEASPEVPDETPEPEDAHPIDIPAPAVADVQITHADAANDGNLAEGDTITVTYTGELDLATVLAGWSGGATAVAVRLDDGALVGLGDQDDTLEILVDGTPVALDPVELRADCVAPGHSVVRAATMTAGTVTDGESARTLLTLTLGPEPVAP